MELGTVLITDACVRGQLLDTVDKQDIVIVYIRGKCSEPCTYLK